MRPGSTRGAPRRGLERAPPGADRELKRSGLQGAWFARAERLLSPAKTTARSRASWSARARASLWPRATWTLRLPTLSERSTSAAASRIRDLMALGLHDKGSALVRQGEPRQAWRSSTRPRSPRSAGVEPLRNGIIYCGVIAASFDVGDLGRAGNWTEAATRWCERQSISGFPGVCRVNRAEVMRLRGGRRRRKIRTAVAEIERIRPRRCRLGVLRAGRAPVAHGRPRGRGGVISAGARPWRRPAARVGAPSPWRTATPRLPTAASGGRSPTECETGSRGPLLAGERPDLLAVGEIDEAKAASSGARGDRADYGTTSLAAHAAAADGAVALAGRTRTRR